MPSALSRATAGATIARSSSPSVPSSPAWGLSPATASRGRGMRNRAGQIARYDAPGLDHKLGRQMCEDFAQRQMDRHRHDRQLGRPQHHDRPLPLAGRLLRQRRQKFGLPRLGETPAVEDILRHRIGNHGGGGAGEDVGDRAAQRRDGGRRARTDRDDPARRSPQHRGRPPAARTETPRRPPPASPWRSGLQGRAVRRAGG